MGNSTSKRLNPIKTRSIQQKWKTQHLTKEELYVLDLEFFLSPYVHQSNPAHDLTRYYVGKLLKVHRALIKKEIQLQNTRLVSQSSSSQEQLKSRINMLDEIDSRFKRKRSISEDIYKLIADPCLKQVWRNNAANALPHIFSQIFQEPKSNWQMIHFKMQRFWQIIRWTILAEEVEISSKIVLRKFDYTKSNDIKFLESPLGKIYCSLLLEYSKQFVSEPQNEIKVKKQSLKKKGSKPRKIKQIKPQTLQEKKLWYRKLIELLKKLIEQLENENLPQCVFDEATQTFVFENQDPFELFYLMKEQKNKGQKEMPNNTILSQMSLEYQDVTSNVRGINEPNPLGKMCTEENHIIQQEPMDKEEIGLHFNFETGCFYCPKQTLTERKHRIQSPLTKRHLGAI